MAERVHGDAEVGDKGRREDEEDDDDDYGGGDWWRC